MKCIIALLLFGILSTAAAGDRPNIVLIFIDDMGYGDIGPFGNKVNQTPNLDRMAAEGNIMRQFYVANTTCTPSRSALMTGTYAHRIGMDGDVLFPGDERGLNPDEITIADMLKANGYATGCFGKWHLGDQPEFLPLAQGFDEYFGIPYSNDMWLWPGKVSRITNLPHPPLPVLKQSEVVAYVSDGPDQALLAEVMTDYAVEFIEAHHDGPFFCYLPHAHIHGPRFARPDLVKKAAGNVTRAAIEEVDTSVGRILDTIRELGISENTLVFFTSDNGGSNGTSMGPLRGGKGGPKYEGHMREPTIAWWPGKIPAGSITRRIGVATDLLPTFATLTGAEVPTDRIIDGKDISDLVLGKSEADSPHKLHYYEIEGIRRGKWKLVRNGDTNELYNLGEDQGERNDLAKTKPKLTAELSALLDAHAIEITANTRPAGFVEPGTAKPIITDLDDLPRLRDYVGLPDTKAIEAVRKKKNKVGNKKPPAPGEILHNGICLPTNWPPRNFGFDDELPVPPYIKKPPAVIPIDVGRQLFVDDFLIESTTLTRTFHQPEKYEGNPILKPETELEMNQGINPMAAPFSDGAFFDPSDNLYKLWYHAGWFDGTALTTSTDGKEWTRPELDVVPRTNSVLAPHENFRRDGVSIWLDHDTENPDERFKMFNYARLGDLGGELDGGTGHLLTSPDGIHWDWRAETGECGDNTTMFYNPFRKVWVFSVRKGMRVGKKNVRMRFYWESEDFLTAKGESSEGWKGHDPVFWAKADKLDRPDPEIGDETQLYKIDAVAYESVMLGIHQILLGPTNKVCAQTGRAKLTDLKIAFSRDGFHWDRTNRDSFLSASNIKGDWERAYITPAGGICNIVGDKLYFYYGAFQGDETNLAPNNFWNGMYANASTGLAILRRDGFASMDAGKAGGTLTTRPLRFNGNHFFVNVDCPKGNLAVEILNRDGTVIAPFSKENCSPLTCDETLTEVKWQGAPDLSDLAGKPVCFRFHLKQGNLYSFWASPDKNGASHGFVAAGGPGFTGPTDTRGRH